MIMLISFYFILPIIIQYMKVSTQDQCLNQFKAMKFKKQYRFIVFQIKKLETQTIVIDRLGQRNDTWETFVNSLPEKEFRYCVFDFEFENKDGMKVSKLVFVNWNPDETPLKNRVLYATAKESFKTYLDLLSKDFTICSKQEMNFEEMKNELDK